MAQEIADSTLLDTWGSSGAKVEPNISKIIEGWQLGEQPPHEYMNWLQNTFGSKLNHILKNGVASWNNETEYLAGSSVQHNGNIWLCKTTNTNSEPADVNVNWKRIITVESLTTILGGYVALTGDQTIAGVKTFSSSPIVPTATTGTQAVNKDYADLKVALASFVGANQSLSGSGYQKLPGGLIIQWGAGRFSASGGNIQTITFPIAFPTECAVALVSNGSGVSAGGSGVYPVVSGFLSTATQLSVQQVTTNALNTYFSWLAIGY